jgi:uncharacterized protein (UPF0335 family)
MSRPPNKSGVDPEKRKKWLQQWELDGDTIASIAKQAGYDPRTIRKQIDIAQQERDRRETRQVILKDALQDHYRDLSRIVDRIDIAIANGEAISSLSSERLYKALEQHLSRAPLWKYLEKWDKLCQEIENARIGVMKKLKTSLTNDNHMMEAFKGGQPSFDEMVEFLGKQADTVSKGGKELDIASLLKIEAEEKESMPRIRLGPYGIGIAPEDNLDKIKDSLLAIQKSVHHFSSFVSMRELNKSREELAPEIREELATILLRRVLPGRCKYCPI